MRSFLVIAATFALLVGLFIGYTMMQTGGTVVDRGGATRPSEAALPVEPRETIVGSGENPWVEVRDENWQVVSRFRASKYDPRKDGRVQVAEPEAVFFMSDGQRLRVRGREGVVAMSKLPEPGEDPRNLGPSQAPTRGELRAVEIELFDSQETYDADAPQRPTELLRVTLDNAAFDNETFRIYTSDTELNGQPLAKDRVPVLVTGRDYDFEGEGLTIRWNEKGRRLDLLQIAHGRKLVVKDPKALEKGTLKRKAAPAPKDSAGTSANAAAPNEPPLPSGERAGVRGPSEQAPRPNELASAPITPQPNLRSQGEREPQRPAGATYRATFSDAVRVVQGDIEIASGDELFIDFLIDRDATNPGPGASPSPRTSKRQVDLDQTRVAVVPTAAPEAQLAAARETPAASTQPVPITVYWTGPLVVMPMPEGAPRPAAGAANVHMVGSPLRLRQERTSVQARSLVYDTGSEQVTLESAAGYPLVMKEEKGGSVESAAVTYSMKDKTATLRGKSRAILPMRTNDDAQPQALTAEWTERCVLHLVGEGLESLVADRADLSGNVRISHPSLKLNAHSLGLVMDTAGGREAAARMQLKEITAVGEVHCEVFDDKTKPQSIDGDKLKVATATDDRGRIYVRRVEADGNVLAKDEQQTFKAGHLTATLSPAQGDGVKPTRRDDNALAQKVDLEHFVAIDGAEYASSDGKRAAADQIEVLIKDGQPLITLLGDARVSDGTNILFGPHIKVEGSEQKATIVGAGSLEAKREAAKGQEPRPVTVEWEKGVVADGKANRVDVTGAIVVTTSEADGTSHAIEGDQLFMVLEDAPQKAGAKPKADRPLMQDKVVKSVTISGEKTAVRSLRSGADGAILRRFMLRTTTLTYDLAARKMTVPAAGKLLFEDRPSRETAAPKKDQEKLAGATAMMWDRQLTYDERAGRITLEGGVFITHEPDADQKQPQFSLDAQTVTAELATADGAKPSDQALAGRDLRRFIAEGKVRFQSQGIDLTATRVEYDPATGLMTATGTDRDPVQIHRGLSRGSFRQALYNLRTNQLQVTDFRGNVR